MPINVGEISFGEIDAKNEASVDRIGSTVFENSFQMPPNVDINLLMSGSKYFVYGQKGCGKTALLLYTKKSLEKIGATCRIILFKSGITEAERRRISSGKGFEVIETAGGLSVEYDYKINWLWYIYRNLFRMLQNMRARGLGKLEIHQALTRGSRGNFEYGTFRFGFQQD